MAEASLLAEWFCVLNTFNHSPSHFFVRSIFRQPKKAHTHHTLEWPWALLKTYKEGATKHTFEMQQDRFHLTPILLVKVFAKGARRCMTSRRCAANWGSELAELCMLLR